MSTTPQTDAVAKAIGRLAAEWYDGAITVAQFTQDAQTQLDKLGLIETQLATAQADVKRIDRLSGYWDSQHVGRQAILRGRRIANPTGSFRAALDADAARCAAHTAVAPEIKTRESIS